MGPCAVFFCIEESVVEAVAAALPEFDGFGDHAIAAPEVGFRDFSVGELFFQFLVFCEEDISRGDDLALVGDPGSQAAPDRAAQEIGERLGGADFFDRAGDLDLAGESDPRKQQGGAGIFGDLVRFPAAVVGEKNKTPIVVGFQQNGPARDATAFIGRAERHRIRLGNSRGAGFVEPMAKLRDRVGIERVLVERLVFVINAQAVDVGVGSHGASSARRRRYL